MTLPHRSNRPLKIAVIAIGLIAILVPLVLFIRRTPKQPAPTGINRHATDTASHAQATIPSSQQPYNPDSVIVTVRAARYVFADTLFPALEILDTARLRRLIGPFTVSILYYNVGYRQVTQPRSLGRYGARITLRSEQDTHAIYECKITMFRLPFAMDPAAITFPLNKATLTNLAIDPSIVSRLPKAATTDIKSLSIGRFMENQNGAILLAAMYEASCTGNYNNADKDIHTLDAQWWAYLDSVTPR